MVSYFDFSTIKSFPQTKNIDMIRSYYYESHDENKYATILENHISEGNSYFDIDISSFPLHVRDYVSTCSCEIDILIMDQICIELFSEKEFSFVQYSDVEKPYIYDYVVQDENGVIYDLKIWYSQSYRKSMENRYITTIYTGSQMKKQLVNTILNGDPKMKDILDILYD